MHKLSENTLPMGEVRYATYNKAAEAICMGLTSTIRIAREAGAVVKLGKSARVNLQKLFDYLDTRCGKGEGKQ